MKIGDVYTKNVKDLYLIDVDQIVCELGSKSGLPCTNFEAYQDFLKKRNSIDNFPVFS